MKWSSKAQIGMVEMIMVMVVVMVLIIIGLIFYFKFSISHVEKVGERISEDKSAVILSTINQLPEVECTYLGGRKSKACADTIKLLALSIKDKENDKDHRRHYSNLYGYMTIVFEQLYPVASETECYEKFDYDSNYPETPPVGCGKWTIYDNPKQGESTFRTMPIALYYPSIDSYTFGQLKIYFY